MKLGRRPSTLLFAALALVSVASLQSAGTIQVTVAAGSDAAHLERRAAAGDKFQQAYVFGQGTFFPGSGDDSAMAEVPFQTIASQLAPGLAQRGYFPTKEAAAADLLITVHWGVTKRVQGDAAMAQDLTRQIDEYVANPAADPLQQDHSKLSELSSLQDYLSAGLQQGLVENARLLGYARALERERERQRVEAKFNEPSAYQGDLMEERYFVILSAWDIRVLRKTQQRKLVWIAHCSTPAAGRSFRDVLPAFSGAGGTCFGGDLDGLKTVRVEFRPAGPKPPDDPAGSTSPPPPIPEDPSS